MKKRCFAGGFTLIELLVVVLIIGISAAIALPQYNKAVERSRVSEALTMINSLEKAMDDWILRHGGTGGNALTSSGFLAFFLGGEGTRQNELMIDLNGLDCHKESDNSAHSLSLTASCDSQLFEYSAGRYRLNGKSSLYNIYVEADRILKSGSNDPLYALVLDIDSSLERTRVCYYSDDLGKSVCESIAAQGWTVEEW